MPSIRTVLRDIHDHGLDPKQRLKLEPGAKRLGQAAPGRHARVIKASPIKEEKPVKSALVELPPPPPPVVDEVKAEETKPVETKPVEAKPVEATPVAEAEVETPKKKAPPKKGDKKDKPEEPPVS